VVDLANYLAARVIANSKASVEAFVQSGDKAERVHIVYNGIEPIPFDSVAQGEVENLRKELGLVLMSSARSVAWLHEERAACTA
jgi:hypothetical protein